jgi:hypothetical protein
MQKLGLMACLPCAAALAQNQPTACNIRLSVSQFCLLLLVFAAGRLG